MAIKVTEELVNALMTNAVGLTLRVIKLPDYRGGSPVRMSAEVSAGQTWRVMRQGDIVWAFKFVEGRPLPSHQDVSWEPTKELMSYFLLKGGYFEIVSLPPTPKPAGSKERWACGHKAEPADTSCPICSFFNRARVTTKKDT